MVRGYIPSTTTTTHLTSATISHRLEIPYDFSSNTTESLPFPPSLLILILWGKGYLLFSAARIPNGHGDKIHLFILTFLPIVALPRQDIVVEHVDRRRSTLSILIQLNHLINISFKENARQRHDQHPQLHAGTATSARPA
jgi:hypothetical protein